MSSTKAQPYLRWLIRRDLPEVLAIEAQSFGRLAWDEDDFKRVAGHRNSIIYVAEVHERIVGYVIFELRPRRLKLLRLAVRSDHRRLGVGAALIAKLAAKLAPERRQWIDASLRETWLDALQFLKAVGFRATGLHRGHFHDPDEDAIVMTLVHPSLADRCPGLSFVTIDP